MRRLHLRPGVVVLGLAVATGAVGGCSTAGPRQTKLMKTSKMTISAAQLRVEVRPLADRFSGLMEEAGNTIMTITDDPAMKRMVLLFFTNGIPAMQQALFQPDPLAALVDAQFLIAQMRGFFEAPTGNPLPEEYRHIAEGALDQMEADLELIVDNAGEDTDYEAGRRLVYETAARYPIDSGFATRRGSAALLSEFTARAGGRALRSIGSITETAEDLVARIDLNAEYVPKFARWQAQLLIMDDIKGDPDVQSVVSAVQQLRHLEMVADFLEDLEPVVADLPYLVAGEREEVLAALDGLLRDAFAFVDGQRASLMHEDVRAERQAILAAVREERAAVLAAVADERRIVLEAVSRERGAAFADLDALVDRAVDRGIDRLFGRVLGLIVVLLGGLAVIGFFFIRALRRSR